MSHDFGGLRAVRNYNLEAGSGQIRGLIGPNGAGKTTVCNLITGIYRPTEGEILLDGRKINGLPSHRIASLGVSRTFQNLLLWRHMTAIEHVKTAHYSKIRYGLFAAFIGTPGHHREEAEIEEKAVRPLGVMGVRHLADTGAP